MSSLYGLVSKAHCGEYVFFKKIEGQSVCVGWWKASRIKTKKINVVNTTFLNYKYLFIKEGAY